MSASPMPHAESSDDVLDYEALYADYQAGLLNRLRGFGPAAGQLELWVPDEDVTTSLGNMIDAVASTGRSSIAIRIAGPMRAQLDPRRLEDVAGAFGTVSLREGPSGWLLVVRDLHEPKDGLTASSGVVVAPPARTVTRRGGAWRREGSPASDGVGEVDTTMYAESLRCLPDLARYRQPRPAGSCDSRAVMVEASLQGTRLWLEVDSATHRIVRAGYDGEASEGRAGILAVLCGNVAGIPIQEASDHGIARVELILRGDRDRRPVSGVVLAEFLDPDFGLAQDLLREARRKYGLAADLSDSQNDYEHAPCDAWLALSDEQRRARITAVFDGFCRDRSMLPATLSFVGLQSSVRVVASLTGLGASGRSRVATAVERRLKDELEPRLELYFEELRDKNALRRLAIITTERGQP
ncbi:MAG: hypothetical protein V3V08_14040 [Nannocystaceae bacterium]